MLNPPEFIFSNGSFKLKFAKCFALFLAIWGLKIEVNFKLLASFFAHLRLNFF